MKILITGARGFVGKNLVSMLNNLGYKDLMLFDIDTEPSLLDEYCRECEFVFHLAGVNRPENEEDFMTGNFGFTSTLLESLIEHENKSPILITSSIQAERDNPYGRSKKAGEDMIFAYGEQHHVPVFVYRLPNVFGKWSRPNYNTVVATFCYNIARSLPISVNDQSYKMELCYIDDVVDEFIRTMTAYANNEKRLANNSFYTIPVQHEITLGELATTIQSFKSSRENLVLPLTKDPLTNKLYSTYLSFLPEEQFSYEVVSHVDNRGSFTEILKTTERGQVSVNVSKPGITKGNHWHRTKNEKFLVVSGSGVVRFRKIGEHEIIEYYVSGDKLEIIDIPTGYTHNITNLGEADMVTIMWANECFNPENPDTYFEEV